MPGSRTPANSGFTRCIRQGFPSSCAMPPHDHRLPPPDSGSAPWWQARQSGTTLLLTVAGELDLELEQRLRPLLPLASDPSVRTVVIDLSRVTFLDCSGLHWLCDLRTAAACTGAQTYLYRPSQCVHRLLHLTSLTDTFHHLDNAPEPTTRKPNTRPCNHRRPGPRRL
ncbi:STAS domain-containing protein [Streptomyces chrestomyceticus]|uniref:STAS domain-containing protein n=1 Tax=Streptomyces chrestomyceticus TaxID=68185 RepID=UPI003686E042